LDKYILISESTTQRSAAGVASRWRPAGICGDRSPDAAAILQLLKKDAFLSIFWHKFLLHKGLLPGALAPCYATEHDHKAQYKECVMSVDCRLRFNF